MMVSPYLDGRTYAQVQVCRSKTRNLTRNVHSSSNRSVDSSSSSTPNVFCKVIEKAHVDLSYSYYGISDVGLISKVSSSKRGDVMKGSRRNYVDLGLDIISEIFLRLPIKDLLRCKSVCKTWYTLTRDPNFINLHMERALHQPRRIILSPFRFYKSQDTPFFIDEEKCTRIPTNFTDGYRIAGSCNGLLCVASTCICEPVFIYNPITREAITLQGPCPEEDYFGFYTTCLHGFGYGRISKRYKVVCVYRPNFMPNMIICAIITEGESSWRNIKFPYGAECLECSDGWLVASKSEIVFVNGAFHWLTTSNVRTFCSRVILALDINTEKFYTYNFPLHAENPSLINFAESLAVVDIDMNEVLTRIWHISPRKTNGTLVYKYTLINEHHWEYPTRLLGTITDGSYLFQEGARMTCYGELSRRDHRAIYACGKKQFVKLMNSDIPNFFRTTLFVPTLVSPRAIVVPFDPMVVVKIERAREKMGKPEEIMSDSFSMDWILRKSQAARKRIGRRGKKEKERR